MPVGCELHGQYWVWENGSGPAENKLLIPIGEFSPQGRQQHLKSEVKYRAELIFMIVDTSYYETVF
jgi:hypothetical protein